MTEHLDRIAAFRALRKILSQRREQLVSYMPRFTPNSSGHLIREALTPGTLAYALMTAICMVIAEELAFRDYRRRTTSVGNDWIGG